ncbi:MAG: hypothetical protein L0287_00040 [Anaerolineae bacterium]|nr:hypothetical protein [Anaerolineae bacterium]
MFVGRLADGTIYGTWTSPQPNDIHHPNIEELPDDHPDVLAFRNRPKPVVIDPVVTLQAELDDLKVRLQNLEAPRA